jgi:regulatory protein
MPVPTGWKNKPLQMLLRKSFTREQALQKLKHFCNYQERCHNEVKEKLFSLGVKKSDHDVIMATLIEENYLNEERFALSFASGKFRLKQWGKIKISAELRKRKISDYCIQKALKQIGEDEYLQTLKKLAAKYAASIKSETPAWRKKKTIDYLLRKGYEGELVFSLFQPA